MQSATRIVHEIESAIPDLPERIRQARETSRRSITELAGIAQMSRGNWYKVEQGFHKTMPLETLKRIESALGTDFGSDNLF